MQLYHFAAATIIAATASAGAGRAQDPSTVTIPVIENGIPKIDGDISDTVWTLGAVISLTHQWFPDDGHAVLQQTECRLLTNNEALFVACRAADRNAESIVAPLRDRDAGEVDDGITITIDPFGDGHEAFSFRVSASGVQSDAQLGRGTGTDYHWDAVWDGRSSVSKDGYTMEAAIPFSSIRMPANSQARPARLLIERLYPRQYAYRFAATPLDRNQICRTCQGMPITLPIPRRAGAGLLLQPTLLAAVTRDDNASIVRAEPGGALRWQATPSTRVSATINPDFSQVEADERDFEINRRFVLTFDERRPFFLEGREMLEGYGDLVYSRRIVDPRWGVRALSRETSRTAAVLVTQEENDTRIAPGPVSSVNVVGRGGATTGVARARFVRGNEIVLGGLVTIRNALESRNTVAGLDGDVQFAGRHRLRFVGALSGSRYASDSIVSSPRGGMMRARYDLSSRLWGVEASMRAITSGFRADAGLLQRVNVWGPELQIRRSFWGSSESWYSLISASVESQYLQTFQSRLLDGKTGASLRWDGAKQSYLQFNVTRRSTAVDSLLYQHSQLSIAAGSNGYPRFKPALEITLGEQPDADNERLGHIKAIRGSVALRPYDFLSVSAVNRYEELRAHATWVYRAAINDVRLEIFPRPNTRLRLVAQQISSRRNPNGGVVDGEPYRNQFTLQALASQRVNTRMIVLVGYVGAGSVSDGVSAWPSAGSGFFKIAWDLAR